jgi:hypothetical protein
MGKEREQDPGNELANRGVPKLEASADPKQAGFLLDTLRKGIPAFNDMLKRATPEQKAGMKDVLEKMLEAKSPDAPVWQGKPPKDMEAFGNRARLALKSLGETDSIRRTETGKKLDNKPDPVANLSKDKNAQLDQLRSLLKTEADRAGIAFDGGEVVLQNPNKSMVPLVETMRKLFGVDVNFVKTGGIDRRLDFGGVYTVGRHLFVNADTPRSHSYIIGHEFLHLFKKNHPAEYEAFEKIANPLVNRYGNAIWKDEAIGYKKRGYSSTQSLEAGVEEVHADAFGHAWADPAFWKELAASPADKSIVARALTALRGFLQQIVDGLKEHLLPDAHSELFDSPDVMRKALIEASKAAIEKAAGQVHDLETRIASLGGEGKSNKQRPTLDTEKRATPEEIKAANDHIDKTLGASMKRAFENDLGGHSADWTPDAQGNIIRVATNAVGGVLTNAVHESMHEFFDRLVKGKQAAVSDLLLRVASNKIVERSLQRIMAEHPDALASLKDPQERLAYAYQFWQAGHPGMKICKIILLVAYGKMQIFQREGGGE